MHLLQTKVDEIITMQRYINGMAPVLKLIKLNWPVCND